MRTIFADDGGHAVVAVGYTKDGYVLIRNSWGIDWGQQGYGLLHWEHYLKHKLKNAMTIGGVKTVPALDIADRPDFDIRAQGKRMDDKTYSVNLSFILKSHLTDALSPQAHGALTSTDNAYAQLVVQGAANPAVRDKLRALSPDNVLVNPPVSRPDAEALIAALWLWHDFLDESHVISQSLHSSTGSFWHAIMHRREGDFSNSKYWYARCADHPVLQQLPRFANDILHPLPADKSLLRLTRGGWDPNAFVDLAEELHNHPEDRRHPTAVALQRLEWKLLFDHCARLASGQ